MNIFSSFHTDCVTLIKQNGEIYNDIPASVQLNKIFVDDASIPIEEGDVFTRKLSNGLEEKYLVIDRGYFEKFHGIDAHYQVSVEKQSGYIETTKGQVISNTYNIGSGEKININSTDNSVNTFIFNANEKAQFQALQDTINCSIDNPGSLIKLVEEMEQSVGKPSFITKYNEFIQSVANHMTIVAPFIPFLSTFLNK